MSAIGTDLSAAAAAAVETAGQAVLRVEGRRRGPSSGVAWSADGVIVAAHHNVEWDEDIAVGLPDGGTPRARTSWGATPRTDVAVLRAAGAAAWPSRTGPAETPKVGHLALALTRPGRTVRASLGVVHALGDEWRTPAGGRVERYLQTDIGLQPGFSGSLLVDLEGRALGMNNAGLVRGTEPGPSAGDAAARGGGAASRTATCGAASSASARIPVRLPAALEKAAASARACS